MKTLQQRKRCYKLEFEIKIMNKMNLKTELK